EQHPSGSGAGSEAGTRGAGSGSATPAKVTNDGGKGDKPGADAAPKGKPGAGPAAGGAAATGGNDGEKSIDDLLGDATSKPKTQDAPKPSKTGLDGNDIKAGMAPLAKTAQGCYDQFGVAGHVKVKAAVDPSGKVTRVDAIGEFAGTPTGNCVAAAVKAGASFPAWDGPPMTINYSYTLNE
ncbi:MAG TPA: hypothetical protein VHE35_10205, partial [Kofleriaceae bacterium]|nr:hypothetical protein [Kofleriaceae bacterium]